MVDIPRPDTLPGLEHTPEPVNVERPDWNAAKMALARLFVAEDTYQASIGERFDDITPLMRACAEPSALYKSLVGRAVLLDRGGRGKQAVLHVTAKNTSIAVALSAAERKVLPDHIEAYGRVAAIGSNHSQKQRKGSAGYDPDAPRRAAEHALERKINDLLRYHGTLEDQSDLLQQFIEATKGRNVGLARMGSEAKMRLRGATLLEQIIPDALDAISDQRGWNVKQEDLARRTILGANGAFS
jgi:hypothetical protein